MPSAARRFFAAAAGTYRLILRTNSARSISPAANAMAADRSAWPVQYVTLKDRKLSMEEFD